MPLHLRVKMKQYTIAIVDDDEDDRDILAAAFRESFEGTAVLTFNDGIDLIEFLQSAPDIPNLVVTDFYMPLRTGLEVIAAMKNDSRTADIPIVLLSTIKNEPAANDVAEMNDVHYFVKPNNLIGYSELAENVMHIVFNH